jgi:hypothetical protein
MDTHTDPEAADQDARANARTYRDMDAVADCYLLDRDASDTDIDAGADEHDSANPHKNGQARRTAAIRMVQAAV